MDVGYIKCPDCDATYAGTHYRTCRHKGQDPRNIAPRKEGVRKMDTS